MFEWFHKRWLKKKLQRQRDGAFKSRGEFEILQAVYKSLEGNYTEDNEPTRISYFIEMAILVARENSEYCDDDHIRCLVEGTLKDNTITGLAPL